MATQDSSKPTPTVPPFRSLADLKRAPIGTELVLVRMLMGPCRARRRVERVTSAGIGFSGDGIPPEKLSWFAWPKAKELVFDDTGFEHRLPGADPFIRYEYPRAEGA